VFYPNVQSFLENDLRQYSTLKVQYQYGSPPKLIMLDADGNHKETIRYTVHNSSICIRTNTSTRTRFSFYFFLMDIV
jgi:hypothetical protein